jgi:signal transduction histidine kinase
MSRRLVVGFVALVAVVLLVVEVPLGITFARRERENLAASGQRDASAFAALSEESIEQHDTARLQTLARRYRGATNANAVVIDRTGAVVMSLKPGDAENRDPALRADVQRALSGTTRSGTRRIDGTRQRFVIEPFGSGEDVHGAVLITSPTSGVDGRIHDNWVSLAVLAAVVFAAASLVGFVLARSISRPLRALERVASELGHGDLAVRTNDAIGPVEVRSLASSFNEMAHRLERLVDAHGAFVADASHQLRTPLTALRLRLENLEASVPNAASADITAAMREIERLSHIVDGLLRLARTEAARPERERIDIVAGAEERRVMWLPLTEERGIELRVEHDGVHQAFAWLGRGHLEQILDNLLSNALDATPRGKAVTIKIARDRRKTEIHVVDEGHGMPDQDRRRAFDRFWRGSDRGSHERSGLGLAIVDQLVRADDGEVSLKAGESGGVDAVVRVPSA